MLLQSSFYNKSCCYCIMKLFLPHLPPRYMTMSLCIVEEDEIGPGFYSALSKVCSFMLLATVIENNSYSQPMKSSFMWRFERMEDGLIGVPFEAASNGLHTGHNT